MGLRPHLPGTTHLPGILTWAQEQPACRWCQRMEAAGHWALEAALGGLGSESYLWPRVQPQGLFTCLPHLGAHWPVCVFCLLIAAFLLPTAQLCPSHTPLLSTEPRAHHLPGTQIPTQGELRTCSFLLHPSRADHFSVPSREGSRMELKSCQKRGFMVRSSGS